MAAPGAKGAPFLDVSVKLQGAFFDKRIHETVRRGVTTEAIEKISARMERGGRGLGARRNTIQTHPHAEDLTSLVTSTRNYPRTTGSTWVKKNYGIARAMAPRVLKKAADRIVADLGGPKHG